MILQQLTVPGEMIKMIEDLILKIYEFSRSYPDSEAWLESCVEAYRIPDVETLEKTQLHAKSNSRYKEESGGCQRIAGSGRDDCVKSGWSGGV